MLFESASTGRVGVNECLRLSVECAAEAVESALTLLTTIQPRLCVDSVEAYPICIDMHKKKKTARLSRAQKDSISEFNKGI
jgi:hypothetical protein